MKLPQMSDRSIMRPKVQTKWGGINHNKNAGGGEIYDMENMSSREYPLIAPRDTRRIKAELEDRGNGIGAEDALWWIDGDTFYYDGVAKGTVGTSTHPYSQNTPYQFAVMHNRVLIWPTKQYYDIAADVFGSFEYDTKTHVLPISVPRSSEWGTVPYDTLERGPGQDYAWPFNPGDQVMLRTINPLPRVGVPITIAYTVVEVNNNIGDDFTGYRHYLTLDCNVYERFPYQQLLVVRTSTYPYGLPAGEYWLEKLPVLMCKRELYISDLWGVQITEPIPPNSVLRFNGWGQYDNRLMVISEDGVQQTYTVYPIDSPGDEDNHLSGFQTQTGGETYGADDLQPAERGFEYAELVIPDLDYICECDNRLWGCKGDTIYASALGDPTRFYEFAGLSTDSWTSDTTGAGDFTGCVVYRGKPVFFKPNAIYKIQGDAPSNFYWTVTSHFGVKEGCAGSIAIADDTVFYLSNAGICAYQGGRPVVISEALGANTRWSDAIGGSDGLRYYVSMTEKTYENEASFHLFVYDTRYGAWWKQDTRSPRARGFAFCNDALYMLTDRWNSHDPAQVRPSRVYRMEGLELATEPEGDIPWKVEFGDETRFYETTDSGSENKKGLLRLQLRCEITDTLRVYVSYDGGAWEQAAELRISTSGNKKQSYNIPLILRRCDYYRLKIEGTGDAVIYSIAEVKYSGSNLQSGKLYSQGG